MGIFDFFKKNKNIENDNGYNEIYKDFNDGSGTLKVISHKKNGKANGIVKTYLKNGILNSELFIYFYLYDGLAKYYHPNAQLYSEGNFIENRPEGLWKYYDESGQLEKEMNYEDGELHGLTKLYKNGVLKESQEYYFGKMQSYTTH